MSQTFTVSIVYENGEKMWLASEKVLTNDESKAYHFKQVPAWRKPYKRFKPQTVIISKVEFTPHEDVK